MQDDNTIFKVVRVKSLKFKVESKLTNLRFLELLLLVVLHVDVDFASSGFCDQLLRDSSGHDRHQELAVGGVVVQTQLAVVDAVNINKTLTNIKKNL